MSRLADVLVGFEERADVQGLAAPEVAVDGPVEGELQTAAVETAGWRVLVAGIVAAGRVERASVTVRWCWPWWVVVQASGVGGGPAVLLVVVRNQCDFANVAALWLKGVQRAQDVLSSSLVL